MNDLIKKIKGFVPKKEKDAGTQEPIKAAPSLKLEKNKNANPDKQISIEEAPSLKVIKSKDEIPSFKSCLSLRDGRYPVPETAQDSYIVLEEEPGSCIIVKAVDNKGFDHYGNTLQATIAETGDSVRTYVADKNIIKIIRDKALLQSMSKNGTEKNSHLIEDFDAIIAEAMSKDVSDIHIEMRSDDARLRFRINGSLLTIRELSPNYAHNLCSVIYAVLSEEKDVTFNPDKTQDAVCQRKIDETTMRIRVATMPAYPKGFDMVMRLLPMGISGKKKTMASLGYSSEQIDLIDRAKSKPVGVIIMAGTTGSGKSTSLTTMISDKIEDHNGLIKVITVEDPPEYQIFGATQSPVVRSKTSGENENPFAASIRAAMRSDPDVIMVGEVRDELSAELLVHAVQSGHQAFTTIHAPSAIGIISRLRSLGVPSDVIGSNDFLSGLIYQTLIPTLCDDCKIPFDEWSKSEENQQSPLIQRLKAVVPEDELNAVYFTNHKGCSNPKCSVGISGRSVVAEIIVPDGKLIELLGSAKDSQALDYFRRTGGKTALDSGIEKMLSGVFDPLDVEHKLGRLDSQPSLKEPSSFESNLLK